MREKALFTWSGGKDSAFALYEAQSSRRYEIAALLTTITEDYNRISLHGVRGNLLEQQADALGLLLERIHIPADASNEEYEAKMQAILEKYLRAGVSAAIFGDIFLADLRKYREDNLARIGMKAIFPIWKRDSLELAHAFVNLGFKAVITCIDSQVLDKAFVGREFDARFISELPPEVDPCGENGEFHSFVYDGPMFHHGVAFRKGEIVLKNNRFYYCDLIPSGRSHKQDRNNFSGMGRS